MKKHGQTPNIKLEADTKRRLESLKRNDKTDYGNAPTGSRETFDDVLRRLLAGLNETKRDIKKARAKFKKRGLLNKPVKRKGGREKK